MHPRLKTTQQQARERFDLDEAMAALPVEPPKVRTTIGAAGYRLNGKASARISEDLLRGFANDTLGAIRISSKYLDALRVVLGNQAQAERHGHILEMNIRNDFICPERVMRTIIDQMKAVGITAGRKVSLGANRSQVVQVFESRAEPFDGDDESLKAMLRDEELAADTRLQHKVWIGPVVEDTLAADEVPY
ncbi:MAG: hypothetical protein QM749_01640 [Aquabacterium sp.]